MKARDRAATSPGPQIVYFLAGFNLLAAAVLIAAVFAFGRDWPLGLLHLMEALP